MSFHSTSKQAKCAVIGNPISHSLSPSIHQRFAQQLGISLNYSKVKLQTDELESFVQSFFQQGGHGLNVTAPFKQQIIDCVDQLTEAAKTCQSANTIYKDSNGSLIGDTTDGPGIMLDLERLGFIRPNQTIAIVGAGGASLPVALALLKHNCRVVMLNRTKSKIANIVDRLKTFGAISGLNAADKFEFDGVISATSEFNAELIEKALTTLKTDGFVYDLNYAERATNLLTYCQAAGIQKVSDGYGMLLGQAAKSFEIWHGRLPEIK
jgi:shikimate dehydrogenase